MQQRFLLQILLLAQHVSGITMPIISSSRVLYSGCCLWYLVLRFSSCWSGVELRVMCPVCRMLQHGTDIVNPRPVTAGSRARSQASPVEIYVGRSGDGTDFRVWSFHLSVSFPKMLHTHFNLHVTRTSPGNVPKKRRSLRRPWTFDRKVLSVWKCILQILLPGIWTQVFFFVVCHPPNIEFRQEIPVDTEWIACNPADLNSSELIPLIWRPPNYFS